jgi:hypothetical protein
MASPKEQRPRKRISTNSNPSTKKQNRMKNKEQLNHTNWKTHARKNLPKWTPQHLASGLLVHSRDGSGMDCQAWIILFFPGLHAVCGVDRESYGSDRRCSSVLVLTGVFKFLFIINGQLIGVDFKEIWKDYYDKAISNSIMSGRHKQDLVYGERFTKTVSTYYHYHLHISQGEARVP